MADLKSEWKEYFNNIIGKTSDVVGTYNGKPVYSIPTGLSTLTTRRENGDYYLKQDGSIGTWKNAENDNNILGAIASVATGGMSDVIQGDQPLSALGEDWGKLGAVVNPMGSSAVGISHGLSSGDYSSALQYLVDPITEPGIDMLARGSGDVIEDAVPGISPYYRTLGSLVGTVVAPGWGTLAGFEVGNKMAGGTADQALKGGAIIGATSAAGSYLNDFLSPVTNGAASPGYMDAAINGSGSVANSAGLGSYIADSSLVGAAGSGLSNYVPTFYTPGVNGLLGSLAQPTATPYADAVANTNYFHTPISSSITTANTTTPDISKTLTKALTKGLMSSTQPSTISNQQTQNIIRNNASSIPVTNTASAIQQQVNPALVSNITFLNKKLGKTPEEIKKEEENLNGYLFKPQNYLGKYLA